MIDAPEFVRRLKALVSGGVGPGLPRREKDRHVFLKAISLGIKDDLPCSERDLSVAMQRLLGAIGPRVDLDSVSLRRALVDFGYLRRDPAGSVYEVGTSQGVGFAAEVESLVPQEVLTSLRQRVEPKVDDRPQGVA